MKQTPQNSGTRISNSQCEEIILYITLSYCFDRKSETCKSFKWSSADNSCKLGAGIRLGEESPGDGDDIQVFMEVHGTSSLICKSLR